MTHVRLKFVPQRFPSLPRTGRWQLNHKLSKVVCLHPPMPYAQAPQVYQTDQMSPKIVPKQLCPPVAFEHLENRTRAVPEAPEGGPTEPSEDTKQRLETQGSTIVPGGPKGSLGRAQEGPGKPLALPSTPPWVAGKPMESRLDETPQQGFEKHEAPRHVRSPRPKRAA